MEQQQTLLKKYEALVSEWNTISLICTLAFSACFIGLVLGLVFFNTYAIVISIVVMFVFGGFEYKSRKEYVMIKEDLEEEMFKMAGMKKAKAKELIRKGLWW
ncbi:MAG: hypothetical protein GTN76_11865 [Candidatus Aenigmarchaeota archaeon]|nr:hypothetical protein [Candidatus Aenigmarchaeota archaeon]